MLLLAWQVYLALRSFLDIRRKNNSLSTYWSLRVVDDSNNASRLYQRIVGVGEPEIKHEQRLTKVRRSLNRHNMNYYKKLGRRSLKCSSDAKMSFKQVVETWIFPIRKR